MGCGSSSLGRGDQAKEVLVREEIAVVPPEYEDTPPSDGERRHGLLTQKVKMG